jgi:hypothetical protein
MGCGASSIEVVPEGPRALTPNASKDANTARVKPSASDDVDALLSVTKPKSREAKTFKAQIKTAAFTAVPSGGVASFLECFRPLTTNDAVSRSKRDAAWQRADPNYNGHLSLAETDGWILQTLVGARGGDDGETIWRAFRPSYIRAFNDAKDVMANKPVGGGGGAEYDDYVQRSEFRLLCAYLCAYAEMYHAFAEIDGGGGEGATTRKDDDRRVTADEFVAGYAAALGPGPFVAFDHPLDEPGMRAVFAEMDANGKGKVLIHEWSAFIEKKEIEKNGKYAIVLSKAASEDPRRRAGVVTDAGWKETIKTQTRPAITSDGLTAFKRTFERYASPSDDAVGARDEGWSRADPNGNGHLSLAEVDGWVKDELQNARGDDDGETIWRAFRPSYIRAFNDAKDVMANKPVGGGGIAEYDDYVQRSEFRLLCAYLCAYAEMYNAFAAVDGGGRGVATDDDRRVTVEEFTAAYETLGALPFVAFELGADPAEVFNAMDADGKGMVLLAEWCAFIEKMEIKKGGAFAETLSKGEIDSRAM